MNKYGARKAQLDGYTFDSIKEKNRYAELKLMEKAGIIEKLALQPKFELQPSFKKNGKTIRAINYIADFTYWDNEKQEWIVEDVKGYKKDKVYVIKKKMLYYAYPGINFIET